MAHPAELLIIDVQNDLCDLAVAFCLGDARARVRTTLHTQARAVRQRHTA